MKTSNSFKFLLFSVHFLFFSIFQSISGINRIKDGYNPATWMLEVTSVAQVAQESVLGVDFAELYEGSELFR
jgi:hypothetical protein